MAAVTQDKVTILKAWDEGTKAGALIQAVRQVAIVLDTQGGTTGDMPAALFQLADISEVYVNGAVVSTTLTGVALQLDGITTTNGTGTGVVVVAWSTGLLANFTGTVYATVKGRAL